MFLYTYHSPYKNMRGILHGKLSKSRPLYPQLIKYTQKVHWFSFLLFVLSPCTFYCVNKAPKKSFSYEMPLSIKKHFNQFGELLTDAILHTAELSVLGFNQKVSCK